MKLNEIVDELLEQGYSNATAIYHGKKLYNEQFGIDKEKYTDEERLWAYNHGFTAEEARCLGLNDHNYKKFMGGVRIMRWTLLIHLPKGLLMANW